MIKIKKYYITFGQVHVHSIAGTTFDKDCVAEISAENYEKARKIAFAVFDGKFYSCYEEKPDMSFFPSGIIKLK